VNTAVSVRLPEDLIRQIESIAQETERSKSFHIQKALEAYVEEFADLQIALDRLRDQTDPTIGSKELKKTLGL